MTDLEDIEDAIRAKDVADSTLPGFDFCKAFFKKFINIYQESDVIDRVSTNEANFNHTLIWPLWELAVNTIGNKLKFVPGEYIIKASEEEYRADDVVLDGKIEIGILETSGKYMLNDYPKYGFDHVKGTFGALSMLNSIYKKYYLASQETATKLRIPFVHARHDHVHLWVLEICAEKLYVLKKLYKFKIPSNRGDNKDVLAMGQFVWLLKKQLQETRSLVQVMKTEHDDMEVINIMNGAARSSSLKNWIDLEIKSPVLGKEYGLLLPVEKDNDEENLRFIKI